MDKKNNIKLIILSWLVIFVVITLSIGYSAFGTKLNVTGVVSKVRLQSDVRISNFTLEPSNNDGTSNYEEYNKLSVQAGITLPTATSTVTYKVEVTNYGNVEYGLLDITGLPENLEYSIDDGVLKEKICDETNSCTLGVSKEFLITIKYKNGGYDSTKTSYDIKLDFDFSKYYTVTYTNIENNAYPIEIMEGDSLELSFGESAPSNIIVKVNDVEITEYTYENGELTIPYVVGNIEIIKQ